MKPYTRHGAVKPLPEPREIRLPNTQYFSVSAIARALGEQTYTIRYWHEVLGFRVGRTRGMQRLFSRSEAETVVRVWRMMRERGITLAGVKLILQEEGGAIKSVSVTYGAIEAQNENLRAENSRLKTELKNLRDDVSAAIAALKRTVP